MYNQSELALKDLPKVSIEEITEIAKKHFPFETANPGQMEVIISSIDALVNLKKKHVIIEAPTGVGKSLIGITIHQTLLDLVLKYSKLVSPQFRSAISTPTKGLQQQYAEERHVNIAMLKGKKNYHCLVHPDIYYNSVQCRINCRDQNCSVRKCPYVNARVHWTDMAALRCTNTAMLIEMCSTICMKPENRGDMIILDECHKLPNALLDHTIMEFNVTSVAALDKLNDKGRLVVKTIREIVAKTKDLQIGLIYDVPRDLQDVISELHSEVEVMLEELGELIKKDSLPDSAIMKLSDIIDILQNISDYCGIIGDTGTSTFIVHERGDDFIRFKPILPSDVAEFGVFRKADYFVHMSATICGLEAYAASLGIPKNEYVTFQVENPIPIDNRKIHYMPVMKMAANMGGFEWKKIAADVDHIIDYHKGQNGIIHTVSYDRALSLQKFSRHRHMISVPRSREQLLREQREAIKQGRPIVFASPSMEEGYDFKGDLSRFQIWVKVPYEYLGDPLVAYVNKKDPSAYFREAILRIVQGCGRSVRGPTDYADTYIIDKSFETLLGRNPEFFPKWFIEAIFES